jgi:hypothetical protein
MSGGIPEVRRPAGGPLRVAIPWRWGGNRRLIRSRARRQSPSGDRAGQGWRAGVARADRRRPGG